jgi:hypothetical protein
MFYDKRVIYASEDSFNTAMKNRDLLIEDVDADGNATLLPQYPLLALVRDIKCWSIKPVYENGELVTEGVLEEGYHCDMRLADDVDFGAKEVNPENPVHKFL